MNCVAAIVETVLKNIEQENLWLRQIVCVCVYLCVARMPDIRRKENLWTYRPGKTPTRCTARNVGMSREPDNQSPYATGTGRENKIERKRKLKRTLYHTYIAMHVVGEKKTENWGRRILFSQFKYHYILITLCCSNNRLNVSESCVKVHHT